MTYILDGRGYRLACQLDRSRSYHSTLMVDTTGEIRIHPWYDGDVADFTTDSSQQPVCPPITGEWSAG